MTSQDPMPLRAILHAAIAKYLTVTARGFVFADRAPVDSLGCRLFPQATAAAYWLAAPGQLRHAPQAAELPSDDLATIRDLLERHQLPAGEGHARGVLLVLPESAVQQNRDRLQRMLRDVYADLAHALGRSGFDVVYLQHTRVAPDAWAKLLPEESEVSVVCCMQFDSLDLWLAKAKEHPWVAQWTSLDGTAQVRGHVHRPLVSPFAASVTLVEKTAGGLRVDLEGEVEGRKLRLQLEGMASATVGAGASLARGTILGAIGNEQGRVGSFRFRVADERGPVLDESWLRDLLGIAFRPRTQWLHQLGSPATRRTRTAPPSPFVPDRGRSGWSGLAQRRDHRPATALSGSSRSRSRPHRMSVPWLSE